jgi:hypothetical protein
MALLYYQKQCPPSCMIICVCQNKHKTPQTRTCVCDYHTRVSNNTVDALWLIQKWCLHYGKRKLKIDEKYIYDHFRGFDSKQRPIFNSSEKCALVLRFQSQSRDGSKRNKRLIIPKTEYSVMIVLLVQFVTLELMEIKGQISTVFFATIFACGTCYKTWNAHDK